MRIKKKKKKDCFVKVRGALSSCSSTTVLHPQDKSHHASLDSTHTMYRTIHLLQLKDCGDIPSLFVSGVGEYEVMAMGDF